jgi:hypothetical protein
VIEFFETSSLSGAFDDINDLLLRRDLDTEGDSEKAAKQFSVDELW